MTLAQLKLAAIRARLHGVWDHPALVAFGEPAVFPSLEQSVQNILDTFLDDAKVRRVADEVEQESIT